MGRCQERCLFRGSRLRLRVRRTRIPRREPDRRRWDYGEDRHRLLGVVEGRVFVVIYTMRNPAIRITSARKANRKEVREYDQNTADE